MEILNKNQRRSALQRMLILGGVILLIIGGVMYNIHRQYADQGKEDIRLLRISLEDTTHKLNGEVSRYKKEAEGLGKDLQACRDARGEEDPRISELKEEIKDRKEEIKDMERDMKFVERQLDDCNRKLAAAKEF